MRRTKIVATLGPASRPQPVLRRLLEAGADIVRLNFSHGTAAMHQATARAVRRESRRIDRPIAVMQDLQGPRIRVGVLPAGQVRLEPGALAFLKTCAGPDPRGAAVLPVTYKRLHRDVGRGARILLRDGAVELLVTRCRDNGLLCEVSRGGLVLDGSGINAPGLRLGAPALTARDRNHLAIGAAMEVDAVALSFVRDASDVRAARRILRGHGSAALVVAKIERAEALVALDGILEAADGVLVARGDLGVERPLEDVPLLQKDIIRRAVRAGVFVITATQMLESMVTNARPTRAEVSDVANAVLDGTDAVMLSAETAVGAHPPLVVETMDRIVCRVESAPPARARFLEPVRAGSDDPLDAVANAAVLMAETARARAIVCFTRSGRTAAALSSRRPTVRLLAFTPTEETRRQLTFRRGVRALRLSIAPSLDTMFAAGVRRAFDVGLVQRGDTVVLAGGHGVARGSANTLKVTTV